MTVVPKVIFKYDKDGVFCKRNGTFIAPFQVQCVRYYTGEIERRCNASWKVTVISKRS